jgi:hypothetical protein
MLLARVWGPPVRVIGKRGCVVVTARLTVDIPTPGRVGVARRIVHFQVAVGVGPGADTVSITQREVVTLAAEETHIVDLSVVRVEAVATHGKVVRDDLPCRRWRERRILIDREHYEAVGGFKLDLHSSRVRPRAVFTEEGVKSKIILGLPNAGTARGVPRARHGSGAGGVDDECCTDRCR